MDSCAVWADATQWLCQWEALNWEINRSSIWRTEVWKLPLDITRKTLFQIGGVKAHANDNKPATNRNQKVDEETRIRKMEIEDSFNPTWY